MKQFPLPEEYYVTVCLYQKTMRSDFRKFISGKPTIQGFLSQTKSVELSEETSKVYWLVDKRNNIVKWRTVINAMAYVVMLQISSNKCFNDIAVYPS